MENQGIITNELEIKQTSIKFTTLPIYHQRLSLVFDDNTDDMEVTFTEDSISKTEILERKELYAHALMLEEDNDIVFTIVLNFNNLTPITTGTVIHEIVHIKNMIYGYLGMVNDLENDEHEAYIVEWITNWVFSQLPNGLLKPNRVAKRKEYIDKT